MRNHVPAVPSSVRINVTEFYGDGAFDTNDLFTLVHAIGASPIIKIKKNASTYHHRGSKYRRKAVREYREKGYRTWRVIPDEDELEKLRLYSA